MKRYFYGYAVLVLSIPIIIKRGNDRLANWISRHIPTTMIDYEIWLHHLSDRMIDDIEKNKN